MSFRYRKSIKLLPGVRLNIGKRGTSFTLGRRGASVNVGRQSSHLNVGIPGSGLSYRTSLDDGQSDQHRHGRLLGFLLLGMLVFILFVLL